MFVERRERASGVNYYLGDSVDGKKEHLFAYGKEKPMFSEPEFQRGLCENLIVDIPDGSVDLIIDDPPYGTTDAMWDDESNWDELAALCASVNNDCSRDDDEDHEDGDMPLATNDRRGHE